MKLKKKEEPWIEDHSKRMGIAVVGMTFDSHTDALVVLESELFSWLSSLTLSK